MANRFDNIIPVRSQYIPQLYTPDFSAMAALLGQNQQQYDQAQAIGEKVPEHLQTPEEKMALNEYVSGVRSQIDDLATIYADQGVAAGNRKIRDLKRTVGRDWQPGGKADRFQKRLAAVQGIQKSIDEQYKDDPRVANFYKQQIQISPFEDEMAANYGIGSPTMDKVLSTEELGKYYNTVIDNISADQIVKGPFLNRSALAGISFKDLLQENKLEYIDWNKAAEVLANSTTPEISQSERVKGRAYGMEGDQGQVLQFNEDGTPKLNETGQLQFADTSIGRLLSGYATGKAFQKQDVSTKIVSDTYAEGRQGKFDDFEMGERQAILTQPFNRGSLLAANGVKVQDGKLLLEGSKKAEEQSVRTGNKVARDVLKRAGLNNTALGTYYAGQIASFFRQAFGKDGEIDLNDSKIRNTVENLEARGMFKKSNQFGELIDMNQEEKTQALGNYLDHEIKNLTASAVVTPYLDKDVVREETEVFFNKLDNSKQNTPGIISNLKAYDKTGKVITGTELMKEANKSTTATVKGQATSPQTLLPYGTRIVQIDDKEYRIEPLLSDKQTPMYAENMLYRAANSPLDNFTVEEQLPPMAPTYTDPQTGQVLQNGLAEYVDRQGYYKMENKPGGVNIYRREGTKWFKLNETLLGVDTSNE